MRPAPVLVLLSIEINQILEESSSKGLLDERVAEIDSGLKAKTGFVGLKKRLRGFLTVNSFDHSEHLLAKRFSKRLGLPIKVNIVWRKVAGRTLEEETGNLRLSFHDARHDARIICREAHVFFDSHCRVSG